MPNKTANQKLFDAAVRHQVSMLRFAEGEADRLIAILKEAEGDLLERLTGAMARGVDVSRLEDVLSSIKDRREQVYKAAAESLDRSLQDLAETAATVESSALNAASPIQLNLASVPLEQLRAVSSAPINGIPLTGWIDSMSAKEFVSVQRAVSLAVLQGEGLDGLVRRIRGTRANGYTDGVMSTSYRNAEALARTAVNHVSNSARELMWEANSEVIQALRWTATLDGRTTSLCAGRDGKMTPVGRSTLPPGALELTPAGARPPAHFQCRSLMIAVIDGLAIAGNRPFVADERTRAKRERAFRKEAKEQGLELSEVRRNWAEQRVGSVPSSTDYTAWLKRQSNDFQDDVLGSGRAKLFRGGAPLERFNDASGKRLTLDQLRRELGM
jgi:SPP1 gp7 family putative phage head morphogenesis protein